MKNFSEPGLGQGRDDSITNAPNALANLAHGLLAILSDQIIEGAPFSDEFRLTIKSYRDRLEEFKTLDDAGSQICIDESKAYFNRSRNYTQGREAELAALVEVMREAVSLLSGESTVFSERLFLSSDRFKRLVQLEDIRDMKKQILSEVRELRQTVLEKQEHEAQNYLRLSKRIESLQSKLQLAREEAMTDPLTKIANRGGVDQTIHHWIEQNRPFTLAMIDVDHFKPINDTHGHRVGDSVLICAAQWLGEQLRNTDSLARFGGDEFVALLSNVTLKQAERKFGNLLAELATRSYVYLAGTEKRIVKFTMSCGLAEFSVGDTAETVIQRADEALYEAKKQRNRVCGKR